MGKKHKDKSSKSKKKKATPEAVVEAETESIEYTDADAGRSEPTETEGIQYADYVNAADVMELIDSLSQDLDQLNNSNQTLQQQISQNQKTLQRHNTVFNIVALILVVGIVTIGYNSAANNSDTTDNGDTVSAGMSEMKGQINNMNSSIGSMSSAMNKLDTKLNTLSSSVTQISQGVSKLATDVSKINTAATSQPQPYDPWRSGRPWR